MSKLRGRKPKFDKNKLHQIFEENCEKIKTNDGGVVGPTSNIYSNLQRRYQISMTNSSIYLAASRWNKSEKSEEIKKLRQTETSRSSQDSSFETSNDQLLNESILSSDDENIIKFSITLSAEIWKTIEPSEVNYNRKSTQNIPSKSSSRKHFVLKPGAWTEILADRITDSSKNIICDLSFKRAKVTYSGEYFIQVFGKCVTCGAVLYGFVEKRPEKNEPVKFEFRLKGYSEEKHREERKSVKISRSQSQKIVNSNKASVQLYRELASKDGQMFSRLRGRVPSANAIRCIRSRNKQTQRLSSDVFQALLLLQTSATYTNTIHMIGNSPFFLIYGSPKQFQLYNMYSQRNNETKISCDATGGLVRKLG